MCQMEMEFRGRDETTLASSRPNFLGALGSFKRRSTNEKQKFKAKYEVQ